jgi:hypothetical protein
MGQYHIIVNLDKEEFIHPHKFGDGLKLMEFGSSGDGTMLGLAVLLAEDNGKGGGDLRSENPIIGSWANNKIVITGDYGDAKYAFEGALEDTPCNLWDMAQEEFTDISDEVIKAIVEGEGKHTSLYNLKRGGGWREK